MGDENVTRLCDVALSSLIRESIVLNKWCPLDVFMVTFNCSSGLCSIITFPSGFVVEKMPIVITCNRPIEDHLGLLIQNYKGMANAGVQCQCASTNSFRTPWTCTGASDSEVHSRLCLQEAVVHPHKFTSRGSESPRGRALELCPLPGCFCQVF